MNFCTFRRLKSTKLTIFKATKIAKKSVLELLDSPKLISRKIWMTEKFWNFHTVLLSPFWILFFRDQESEWKMNFLLTLEDALLCFLKGPLKPAKTRIYTLERLKQKKNFACLTFNPRRARFKSKAIYWAFSLPAVARKSECWSIRA